MEESVREEWRDVKGYEGRYRVSSDGRVQSCSHKTQWQWRDLRTSVNEHGYHLVKLQKNRSVRNSSVHRIVAKAFLGEPADGMEVDHINGDKNDNRASNLEWVSRKENVGRHWRKNPGRPEFSCERHPMAKATPEMVAVAIALYVGGMRPNDASARVGMGKNWLCGILNGKLWSNLNLDTAKYKQQHALSKQRAGNLRK
jgi:hypothetical protein